MRRNKYHATKITTDEGVFDSKKEYLRWITLKEMERRGLISELRRQVVFELIPAQPLNEPRIHGKRRELTERAIKYIADFVYIDNGREIVEDVKGIRLDDYKIKRKLMKYIHGIEIKEV